MDITNRFQTILQSIDFNHDRQVSVEELSRLDVNQNLHIDAEETDHIGLSRQGRAELSVALYQAHDNLMAPSDILFSLDKSAPINSEKPLSKPSLRQRLDQLIQEISLRPTTYQVHQVNRFFNDNIGYSSDQQLHGQRDYWQSLDETLKIGWGDCEDFVAAKYQTLKKLGIPEDNLRFVYVKTDRDEAHMILRYVDDHGNDLILDNASEMALSGKQRNDLRPKFSFNRHAMWESRTTSDWSGLVSKNRVPTLVRQLFQKMPE